MKGQTENWRPRWVFPYFTKVQGESLFLKHGNYKPEVSRWFRRRWLKKFKYCFKVVFSCGVLKCVPAGTGRYRNASAFLPPSPCATGLVLKEKTEGGEKWEQRQRGRGKGSLWYEHKRERVRKRERGRYMHCSVPCYCSSFEREREGARDRWREVHWLCNIVSSSFCWEQKNALTEFVNRNK